MIQKITFYITYGVIKILSLIPLCIMHLVSDILTLLCFIIPPLRYRKKVVQKNLRASFPEKSKKELRILEFNFYRFFFDMAFESIKACSMSARWMKRHMEFVGLENFYKEFENALIEIAK